MPDLREGVSVKMCNQPKLRQELCYADVSSLMFKTCLDGSKLTKYELQLETLKGKYACVYNTCRMFVCVCVFACVCMHMLVCVCVRVFVCVNDLCIYMHTVLSTVSI